jgi:REP element-mobilizing transposase RayT
MAMTAPREILPGRTYLITRRCTQRQFLLRPDDKMNAIIAYCLAEAATRYDINLIAWTAMSNHYHTVVHDPHARLPAFLEHFHKMLAKCLNVRWSRWENVWSSEPTSRTCLRISSCACRPITWTIPEMIARV